MRWNHRILSHHGTPQSTRDSSVPKQDSGWIGGRLCFMENYDNAHALFLCLTC
jgi:hypothetical protein